MWAVLRVDLVEDGKVSLVMPHTFHDRQSGAQHDIDDGAAMVPEYFTTETMAVPITTLKQLQDDGTLADVVPK